MCKWVRSLARLPRDDPFSWRYANLIASWYPLHWYEDVEITFSPREPLPKTILGRNEIVRGPNSNQYKTAILPTLTFLHLLHSEFLPLLLRYPQVRPTTFVHKFNPSKHLSRILSYSDVRISLQTFSKIFTSVRTCIVSMRRQEKFDFRLKLVSVSATIDVNYDRESTRGQNDSAVRLIEGLGNADASHRYRNKKADFNNVY